MKALIQWSLFILFLVAIITPADAQQLAPVEIGLRHLESQHETLGLTKTDIENYRVSDHYLTKHNGVSHIYLIQQHAGIDVSNALININVLPSGEILNMGNRFVADLASKVNVAQPAIDVEVAIQKAAAIFNMEIPAELTFREVKNGYLLFENGNFALEPIRCQLVYTTISDDKVKLSWQVELYQLDAQHSWNVKMDAVSGELLRYYDQVIHCSFSKDEDCDDPTHQHHHHSILPKNNNKVTSNTNSSSAILANSYNVYPMPIESPNHGDRAIVVDPANLEASPLGWHDTNPNAQQGEFTITRGNNVHAYHDIFDQNSSLGDEPDGGVTLDFDIPIDLDGSRAYGNRDASIVNLFYWNNLVHDVFYLRGFDEAAGNFQQNNLGNGGQQNDAVNAEALDGSGTNNANFFSGQDGDNGRMQMFVWGSNVILPLLSPLVVEGNLNTEYELVMATFGAGLSLDTLTAEMVFVEDEADETDEDDLTTDGCDPIINAADIDGKIAILDRGGCQFGFKVLAAEQAGAIAVVVCNNEDEDSFPMGPGNVGDQVTIPVGMITMEDCAILRSELPGVTGTFLLELPIVPFPGPTGRDSGLDNGVIVHEYGHGISTRSTGGPNNSGCLFNDEQAGEGWSDWFGLVMQTTADHLPGNRRGVGTYLEGQATDGDGIRPFPYTRDISINPFVYSDLNEAAIPHGVGSIWATMLWDLYWNFVDEYGFDDDIYNGTGGNNIVIQLVIDGLKLQTCSPSFIDSRDAILAADVANNDGINQCLIWNTFARRGLGENAAAGGVNDFNTPDQCDFSLKINKVASVDEVEVGDIITYNITSTNASFDSLQNITITDPIPDGTIYVAGSSTCPNTTVANEVISIEVGNMPSADSLLCSYQLQVVESASPLLIFRDEVEEENVLWDEISGNATTETWEITNNDSFEGEQSWYANNQGFPTDQYLESKYEVRIEGPNPVLSFWHRYDTSTGFDGGIVEVSTNDGNDYFDVNSNIFQNGYPSRLEQDPTSALSGRRAFHGNSDGYVQTLVNMSTYIERDVKIRFRFATNQGGGNGGDGWYIDNIILYDNFSSITNEACISSDLGENKCSQAVSVVLGDIFVNTTDVEENLKISIAPNPTTGIVYLTMNANEAINPIVSVFSVDGKLLRSDELSHANGTFPIDLSAYPSGMYFMQIQSGEDVVTEKILLGK